MWSARYAGTARRAGHRRLPLHAQRRRDRHTSRSTARKTVSYLPEREPISNGLIHLTAGAHPIRVEVRPYPGEPGRGRHLRHHARPAPRVATAGEQAGRRRRGHCARRRRRGRRRVRRRQRGHGPQHPRAAGRPGQADHRGRQRQSAHDRRAQHLGRGARCRGSARSPAWSSPGTPARPEAPRSRTCSSATPTRPGSCRSRSRAATRRDPRNRRSSTPATAPTSTTTRACWSGYRWYDASGQHPLFPFGFGLSYTDFQFSDLAVHANSARTWTVTATVTNTGSRPAPRSRSCTSVSQPAPANRPSSSRDSSGSRCNPARAGRSRSR